MAKLAELQQQITGVLIEARNIASDAEKADRNLTAEESARVTELLAKGTAWKDEVNKLKGDDALRESLKALGEGIGLSDDSNLQIDHNGAQFLKAGDGTLGERVFKSDAYQGFLKHNARNDGSIPDTVKGFRTDPVNLGGLKALVTGVSDTSAGALVNPERLGYFAQPWRPLTMRDLVASGVTGSDTIEYVTENVGSRVNNAAPVPEATSAAVIGDGTGGTTTAVLGGRKPESGFALVKVTEVVKTIAHWIPATKRALSDAGQVRALIDNFLLTGLEQKLEDQMVAGNGTGENFTGILQTNGLTAQPYSATVTGLDPLLETTLKAKTKVRTVGRANPTAYVFNPEDWEKIQLARLAKNPANEATAGGVETLHGLPVVQAESFPAGTGMVADWKRAMLWDREQASVVAFDQHADFAIRNLVAFLAELRAAFGVLRPAAFVSIDLTA